MISRLGQDKEAAFVSSSVDFHEMVINFKVLWKHLVSTEKKIKAIFENPIILWLC